MYQSAILSLSLSLSLSLYLWNEMTASAAKCDSNQRPTLKSWGLNYPQMNWTLDKLVECGIMLGANAIFKYKSQWMSCMKNAEMGKWLAMQT